MYVVQTKTMLRWYRHVLLVGLVVVLNPPIYAFVVTPRIGMKLAGRGPASRDHVSPSSRRPAPHQLLPDIIEKPQYHVLSSRVNSRSGPLAMADESKSGGGDDNSSKLPFWLDPNTKGGALVFMVVLFAVPYSGYQFMVSVLGYDEVDAGVGVGMGFTVLSMLAWISTYLFRVATKDMTYVRLLLVMLDNNM